MFGAKRWEVCPKQSKHSVRVYLVDVVLPDQFYLHVSLSEYSVTKFKILGQNI